MPPCIDEQNPMYKRSGPLKGRGHAPAVKLSTGPGCFLVVLGRGLALLALHSGQDWRSPALEAEPIHRSIDPNTHIKWSSTNIHPAAQGRAGFAPKGGDATKHIVLPPP